MDEEKKIPKMMELLFGEAAEAAVQGAGERRRRWSLAFDGLLLKKELVHSTALPSYFSNLAS